MEEHEGEVFKHPNGCLVVKSNQRESGLFGQKTGKVNLFSLEAKDFVGELTPEIEKQLESIGVFSIYD